MVCQTRCGVVTNVRKFLREFPVFKHRARRGEVVRVQDKEGEFLFTAATPRKSLLGAARGKITLRRDIVQPTLPDGDWKPTL